MNKEYVLFNLSEAAEELAKATEAFDENDHATFEAWIVLTYRKLNRAWNSRYLSPDELAAESPEQFESRCAFPTELSELIWGL